MPRKKHSRTRGGATPGRDGWGFWLLVAAAMGVVAWLTVWQRANEPLPNPGVRTILAVVVTASATSASVLFHRRWRESGSRGSVIAAGALALLALAGGLSALTTDLTPLLGHDGLRWGISFTRSTGGLLLVLAVHEHTRSRPAIGRLPVPFGIVVALVGAAHVLPPTMLGGELPDLDPETAAPSLTYALAALPIVPVLLWGAWRGFLFSRASSDVLLRATSGMLLLLALSRFSVSLHPVAAPDMLHAADLLRGAAFAVLAAGCIRASREYWRAKSLEVIQEARSTLASDLHDGIAQDLALISAQSRWVAKHPEDTAGVALVASAAQRALAEARASISTLRRDINEPLAETLTRTARAVASRQGLTVTVEVDPRLRSDKVDVEALLRELRQAIITGSPAGSRCIGVRIVAQGAAAVVHVEAEPESERAANPSRDRRPFDREGTHRRARR